MPDILHLARIRAPVERVYAAVTTPEGVRGWWTRDARLDDHVGGEGEFAFRERRVVTRVRIEALRPPAEVGWTVLSSNAPGGWEGSTIHFDLRADGDVAVLLFAHRNLQLANEEYARITSGWGFYLISLRQYLETGAGVPAPEDGVPRIVRA